MAQNRVVVPIKDGNAKMSSVTFPVDAPTDLQITALYDALGDIILGKRQGSSYITDAAKDAADAGAAPGGATRNNKWLCTYQDNVDLSVHRMEIPTADLEEQALPSPYMSLAAGNGLAFKTAFEAIVKSPIRPGQGGNNAVTLTSVQFIGRAMSPE
jgi:hypothetical protein